jgi:hypothetical protein
MIDTNSRTAMNRKALSECLGGVFWLRPNPIVTKTKKPIKESVNSWTLVAFSKQKTPVLQHNHTDYRIDIPANYVRGHEPPDMIVLRGQVRLDEDLEFSFEPFTEGLSAGDPAELVKDSTNRESTQLYATLKLHEGKVVSVRFPNRDDGTVYGPREAILQEVTPHFVKLYEEAVTIKFLDRDFTPSVKIPEFKKAIVLSFILYEEDDEKESRPRLVIDYSHWQPTRALALPSMRGVQGPSSESNSITLRHTSPPFSSLRIAFIHGRYHTLSLCITLRLNRRYSDFGSEGWGFKSLRAHHFIPVKH